MSQQRDPLSELQRLTDHLAHLARTTTEIKISIHRLEPLIRVALLVWIVFPILTLVVFIVFLGQLLALAK